MSSILINNPQRNKEGFRSLSVIFSAPYFRQVLFHDNKNNFNQRLDKHYQTVVGRRGEITNRTLIKKIYNQLSANYCNEYVYKNEIINRELITEFDSKTALNELKIGDSVADLVLVNGEAKLFEVKTELDSPYRLKKQLASYEEAIENIYIVTSSKNIDFYLSEYGKSNYGIFEFLENGKLKKRKTAIAYYENLKHETLFKILRKNEYLDLINAYFGMVPSVPNTLIFKTCLDLVKNIEIKKFQVMVLGQLKRRKLLSEKHLVSSRTPKEMKQLCCVLDFGEEEYQKLYNFLSQKTCISPTYEPNNSN